MPAKFMTPTVAELVKTLQEIPEQHLPVLIAKGPGCAIVIAGIILQETDNGNIAIIVDASQAAEMMPNPTEVETTKITLAGASPRLDA